jgi:hypothetical protein
VPGTPGNPLFGNLHLCFQTAFQLYSNRILSGAVKYMLYKVCVANLEWTSLSALIYNVTAGAERLNHVDQ